MTADATSPSIRAGIVVTGNEVLSGVIADRNGPWLSERLREQGVELAHIIVVADRRADLRAALDFLARERVELVITSGGLGPTADDLTAEVVGGFAGRAMVLDEQLEERILAILRRNRARWSSYSEDAMRAGNRKQAVVPEGATILEPVGTAPGLIVPPASGHGPLVLVLPGPPGELQPMWATAAGIEPLRSLLARAGTLEQRMLRLFGVPESEIALSLRAIEQGGVALDRLEITTCLRRGEIEVATVFVPDAAADYEALLAGLRARHGDTLFSEDGSSIDEQVARLLDGYTVATAESCTGGLMAARLTDRAGSSAYVLGGVVVYSNAAKTAFADVPAELIERHGAVSPEVAAALADGAIARFGAQLGIGITGVAGPGGGSAEKPVGTVYVSVASAGGERVDRMLTLPGGRAAVRERTTTVAMHLLRGLLLELRGDRTGS
jgi:nicotinamide-nucleotide amidase